MWQWVPAAVHPLVPKPAESTGSRAQCRPGLAQITTRLSLPLPTETQHWAQQVFTALNPHNLLRQGDSTPSSSRFPWGWISVEQKCKIFPSAGCPKEVFRVMISLQAPSIPHRRHLPASSIGFISFWASLTLFCSTDEGPTRHKELPPTHSSTGLRRGWWVCLQSC